MNYDAARHSGIGGIYQSGGVIRWTFDLAGAGDGCEVLKEMPRKPLEPDKDYEVRLDTHAHIIAGTTPNGPGERMRLRWQDPEWRAATVARMREARRVTSDETRAKLSASKKGVRNMNARRCRIVFGGMSLDFPTVTEAAHHYEVSQQTMDLWLRGVTPWPGTGKRTPRAGKHLVGITGGYL